MREKEKKIKEKGERRRRYGEEKDMGREREEDKGRRKED